MSSYDKISIDLSSQLCVRANPQRFVSSISQPHEQAIFTTVLLPQGHPVLLSTNVLTFGPLTASTGGIPLRMYAVGPGTRPALTTSPVDRNLPNFDATTFFAHFGGDCLSAEQFEVLWFFQEYARNGHVRGLEERAKEEVRSMGFQSMEYPSYVYDKSRHEHVYKGWKPDHLEFFWRDYCEVKITGDETMGISRERSTWSYVHPPRLLTATELQMLDEVMNKKVSTHDKYEKLAVTLEQRIAASRNTSGGKDPKTFGSKAIGFQGSGSDNKTTSNKNRQTSRVKESNYKVVKPSKPSRPQNIYGRGSTTKPLHIPSAKCTEVKAGKVNQESRRRSGILTTGDLGEGRTILESRRRRFESQEQDAKKPAPLALDTIEAPEVSSANVFDGIPSALLDWCVRDDHDGLKEGEMDEDNMCID